MLCGCVTIYNPATEQKETLLIDTLSEVAMGQDMNRQIQKELKVSNDPQLQQRLNNIGNKVAKFSDRQDLAYIFQVIKDDELNAFAIPGGFIYVNSGLINRANDDELACVLGHEIGHVAAKHSVKKLQSVLGYQIIIGIALGVSGQQTMGQAMDIVFNLVSLGYSRKDEFLADRLCVKYARKSGFNPYGTVTFFKKLEEESNSKGANLKLVFLSSHPPIGERIKAVEYEINNPKP